MRVAVTGCTGHIGSSVVRRLISSGHSVLGLDRLGADFDGLATMAPGVDVEVADLVDMRSSLGALLAFAPDVAVHLAWQGVGPSDRGSADQITVNVGGAIEFLRAAHDAGCTGFVGLGSQAEYGPYTVPLREDLPAWPQSAYGVGKLAAYLLTAKLAEILCMRHVWLRLTASYGPGDDACHLIPSVIQRLLRREPVRLSPGAQVCDYLYVDDVAEAIALGVEHTDASGLFVLGSGEPVTVQSLCGLIRDRIDPSADLGFGAAPYRADQSMHILADATRISDAVAWRARVPLEEGLHRTIASMRLDMERNGFQAG